MRRGMAVLGTLVVAVMGLSACGASDNEADSQASQSSTSPSGAMSASSEMPMSSAPASDMPSEMPMSDAPASDMPSEMPMSSAPASDMPSEMPMSSAPPASSAAPAEGVTITIEDFKYTVSGPVSPGDKITVTNNDDVAHTVTADSGDAFDVKVSPGSPATFTAPSEADTYKFHCTYHANMHGKLVVK